MKSTGMLRVAVAVFCSSGVVAWAEESRAAEHPLAWNPNWQDGLYWIVESPLRQSPIDPVSEEMGEPVTIGTSHTRFTVRFLPAGARLEIEPKIVGEYEFGQYSARYEVTLRLDTFQVMKSKVVGTDMVNEPYAEEIRRLPSDPVSWWSSPWGGSVFPDSLVLAIPVFTRGPGPGVLHVAPWTSGTSFRQTVELRQDVRSPWRGLPVAVHQRIIASCARR